MDYHEAISNLKFISRIKSGDKVNVKFMFVQQDGIMTKISRTLHLETRQNTLNFVKKTVIRCFEIISSYLNSKDESKKHTCVHIVSDMKLAKRGLENLKETYVEDIKLCCDLDTILQEIDAKLLGIDTKMKKCGIKIKEIKELYKEKESSSGEESSSDE